MTMRETATQVLRALREERTGARGLIPVGSMERALNKVLGSDATRVAPGGEACVSTRATGADYWITPRGHLADRLAEHAARLGTTPQRLLTDLVYRALEDDLVDAVLDRGN
jgi:hypothetical protein